ncbi:MAG: nicotinate phosphoribosyltransferase [Bacteroidales bacterium]
MIITSFLDNDLYKFTTMHAIVKKFPAAWVRYEFINRGNTKFPKGFADKLRSEVMSMKELYLTEAEEAFITKRCYFFPQNFIDTLRNFKYEPKEVHITQNNGDLKVHIEGLWYRTVLWEVPLMAIISELYFKETNQHSDDSWQERTTDKAKRLSRIGVKFSEFGTRRRFSGEIHNKVVKLLQAHSNGSFTGTSNVLFAMNHNTGIIGTHPHEWFMYHGAHFGYRIANEMALENWSDVYQGALGIALTDTYTSANFFQQFKLKHAKLFDGVRWDSGDPIAFTNNVIEHYKSLRIDPKTKTIVYSDSLNMETVEQIENHAQGKIRTAYGIGTHFTNDVGATPLNIVIKLFQVRPRDYDTPISAIKLSDVSGKHSGDQDEIEICQRIICKK